MVDHVDPGGKGNSEPRLAERVVKLETHADHAATKANLERLRADIFRMMLFQTVTIIGAIVALVKLLP